MGVGSASVVDYANTYPGTASHVNATGSVGDFEVVVDGSGATTLSLNFQTATSLDPRITFTRASSATQYNSAGTLISVDSDVARLDYDPVTLAPKGLLIEDQRTNLLFPSIPTIATLGSLLIGTGIVTKTANATMSPDGTVNATAYTSVQGSSNSGTGSSIRWLNGVTTAGTYTISFYAKALVGGYTASVRFVDSGAVYDTTVACTVADGESNTVTTGWRRYYATATLPAGSTGFYSILTFGSNTDTTYLYGLQFEAGAFPTSYIPTTSATVTRAADNTSMVGSNFSSWYNQSEGTLWVSAIGSTTAGILFSANDGTNNERVQLSFGAGSGGNINLTVTDGTILQAQPFISGINPRNLNKSAGAYKLNDFAISVNGVTPVTDTLGTIPTPTQATIGMTGQGATQLNGWIQAIKYYPTRLPNGTLQGLTA